MSVKEKLLKRLKSNPKDFTYVELETALISLGFSQSKKGKTSGSRIGFQKSNISIILHKPHPRKELPEYQVKKILKKLESENLI